MIRNDSEYQEALRRLEGGKKSLDEYRAKLEAEGLPREQIAYAIQPSESFVLQVREEVTEYERIKRGDLGEIVNLHGLGRMLIAARIAAGATQRELAERLEAHESQVSRDERSEYHGVTVERASRILDALGITLSSFVVRRPGERTARPRPPSASVTMGGAPPCPPARPGRKKKAARVSR